MIVADDFVPVDDDGLSTLADLDAFLRRREEAAVDLLADGAGRIALAHVEAYAATLTAAGDVSALDGMGAEWNILVDLFALDQVSKTFAQGAIQAFASSNVDLDLDDLEAFTAVVNERAITYQKTATNRLVGIGNSIWSDVRDTTVRNIQVGVDIKVVTKEIEQVAGVARSRAAAIARTETMGAYNAGDLEGATALGDLGPVEKYWLAALDGRTRDSHAAADGQIVPFGEPFMVGGSSMTRPLDPGSPASEVVNCRCVMLMFYVGDTRPDGSIVEPVGAPVEALDKTDAVPTPKTQAEMDAQVRPDPVPAPTPAPAAPRSSSQELDDAVARNDALRDEIAAIEAQNEALRLEYEGLTAAVDAPKMSGVIVAALVEGDGTVTYADGDVAPLHQTLAYLGTVDDLADGDRDTIVEAVEVLAASMTPFDGYVCGVASLGPDGDQVALTEAPELQAAHDAIVDNGRTSELNDAHNAHPSWISHITFGDGNGWSFGDLVRFDRLAVFVGDERIVIDLTR